MVCIRAGLGTPVTSSRSLKVFWWGSEGKDPVMGRAHRRWQSAQLLRWEGSAHEGLSLCQAKRFRLYAEGSGNL